MKLRINNDTDVPEQLHWHGQFLPRDVITFTPGPSGLRFYHTHNRA
jgi:hypothetical protein